MTRFSFITSTSLCTSPHACVMFALYASSAQPAHINCARAPTTTPCARHVAPHAFAHMTFSTHPPCQHCSSISSTQSLSCSPRRRYGAHSPATLRGRVWLSWYALLHIETRSGGSVDHASLLPNSTSSCHGFAHLPALKCTGVCPSRRAITHAPTRHLSVFLLSSFVPSLSIYGEYKAQAA